MRTKYRTGNDRQTVTLHLNVERDGDLIDWLNEHCDDSAENSRQKAIKAVLREYIDTHGGAKRAAPPPPRWADKLRRSVEELHQTVLTLPARAATAQKSPEVDEALQIKPSFKAAIQRSMRKGARLNE